VLAYTFTKEGHLVTGPAADDLTSRLTGQARWTAG
jgi:hypothetical protein